MYMLFILSLCLQYSHYDQKLTKPNIFSSVESDFVQGLILTTFLIYLPLLLVYGTKQRIYAYINGQTLKIRLSVPFRVAVSIIQFGKPTSRLGGLRRIPVDCNIAIWRRFLECNRHCSAESGHG